MLSSIVSVWKDGGFDCDDPRGRIPADAPCRRGVRCWRFAATIATGARSAAATRAARRSGAPRRSAAG